jgi:hypothetical protein
MAAALFLASTFPAQAEIAGGNFTAVDNVSAAVATVAVGEQIDVFVNGVYDMVIALQVEIGSPGSGKWTTVTGFADLAPTANTWYHVSYPSRALNERYRLIVTTDTSGTAYYSIVSNRGTPTDTVGDGNFSRTHYRAFDDFFHGTLPITTTHNGVSGSYIVHIGAGASAVLSVIEGQPEGAMTFSNGSAGDDTDLSTGSLGLLTNGALVSSGLTIVEFRAHMSQITDANVGFGLVDVISAATEIAPFEVNSNVVAEGAVTTVANAAAIYFDTDADVDQWQAVANNANTIQNNADEYELNVAPVATTYQLLRIEVDATGDCFWYIDGALEGAMATCVATTAVLIPYWWAGSAQDATGTVNKINVDYVDFWAARPSS